MWFDVDLVKSEVHINIKVPGGGGTGGGGEVDISWAVRGKIVNFDHIFPIQYVFALTDILLCGDPFQIDFNSVFQRGI